MTPSETLVCATIRGEVTSWQSFGNENSLEQLVKVAIHHSVHLLLLERIKKTSVWSRWPACLREKLENAAATASTLDLVREKELRSVLTRLNERGIRPILLKGVPLAYTLYPSPTLRPREDTDLLIRESELQRVTRILSELGYDGPVPQTDNLTSYECLYRRKDSFGVGHNLDVHWKINNAQLFAKTFTFEEVSADAVKIPSLAPCAIGLGYSHALLLACMHRFGHAHAPFYVNGNTVYAGDNLRWVYDIHLLSSALSAAQWSKFATSASTKGIATFCLDGLNAAKEAFNAPVPAKVMCALHTAACDEAVNVQSLRVREAAWFFANMRSLPSWGQRIAFIKQSALPSTAYMMEKYQTRHRLLLPLLYGHRLIYGVSKRLTRFRIYREHHTS